MIGLKQFFTYGWPSWLWYSPYYNNAVSKINDRALTVHR
jgi:hypothetical protein